MRWEEYYDKISEWATSTAVSRMSKLETFGPSKEITEVITEIALGGEKAAVRLFKKALAAGVKFSGEELEEISLYCDEALLNQAVASSAGRFTTADLDTLYGVCDTDILLDAARKYNIKLPKNLACGGEEIYTPEELAGEYDYIVGCLYNALEYLQIAMTYSAIDFSSRRRSVTLMKYAALLDAQTQIECALNVWERLDVPDNDKHVLNDVLPHIAFVTMWENFSHDGFLTNFFVNRRILKIDSNIRRAIQTICNLRDV